MLLIPFLVIAMAVGSAAVGGVYLAFAVMVMPAFRRLPEADAAAAMLEINVRAERGVFRIIFAATLVLSIALPIWVVGLAGASTVLFIVGSALSFASGLVTIFGNVPLNNRLVRDGASFWSQYDKRWSRLNTIRAVLALAAVGVVASAAVLDR